MKILLEGPILTQSGYGEHARLIFKSLKQRDGLEIYTNPLDWGTTSWSIQDSPEKQEIEKSVVYYSNLLKLYQKDNNNKPNFDIQIHVGILNEFEKKAPYSVCVTAGIETDRVSPEWLVQTHKGVDKLIVPSSHAKEGFINTAYEVIDEVKNTKTKLSCNQVPIDVVPYPVKELSICDLDLNIDTEFNFLSIALMGPRKNQVNLIEWFIETFHDDSEVGLVLKTAKSAGSVIDKQFTRSFLHSIVSKFPNKKCKIYLLHGDLSEEEIHSLYNRSDIHAYVTTTHGEGYGLPLFEAAYSGMPIVATNWSGHLDFLHAPFKEAGKVKKKALFSRVDYDLKEIQPEARWKGLLTNESRWAFPKEKSFKEKLNKMRNNYGMYKKWATALKEHLVATHSEKTIINDMAKSLLSEKDEPEISPIEGISFCISTNASKIDKTLLEIKSINNTMKGVNIPYEIVISGVTEPFSKDDSLILNETPQDAESGLLAKLRNNAASMSKYDVLVFVDDDFIFSASWAERLIEFSKDNGWQVLGNKILLPDGGRFWDRCTITPHKLVNYDYPDLCAKVYQTGGFWIMRRETYLEHKWDSSIPINAAERGLAPYNEDIDMTIRIHNAGIKFCFDKNNLVWHNDDSYMEFNEQTLKKDLVKKMGVDFFPEHSKRFTETVGALE